MARIPDSVQLVLLFRYFYVDLLGVFALGASAISMAAYAYNVCVAFDYNASSRESLLFSWRMSSVSIVSAANCYGNKSVLLRAYLVSTLNMDAKRERLEVLPSARYYDTDIGGLTVRILVTTERDKKRHFYEQKLREMMENESMSKQMHSLWNLAANEHLKCYKLKLCGVTPQSACSVETEMDTVRPSRLSRHIKINSGSVQMPDDGDRHSSSSEFDESSTDREFDEFDEFENAQNAKKQKDSKRFVGVTTMDDVDAEEYALGFALNVNEQYVD